MSSSLKTPNVTSHGLDPLNAVAPPLQNTNTPSPVSTRLSHDRHYDTDLESPIEEEQGEDEEEDDDADEEPETPSEEEQGITDSLPSLKLRPQPARTSTDPPPTALLQGYWPTNTIAGPPASHRNRSPYSRTHVRSRSSGAALNAPKMARAKSSPAVQSTSRLSDLSTPAASLLANAPLRPAARQRSPFRYYEDNTYNPPPPRSPSWYDGGGSAIESIQEDSELSITPRNQIPPPQPVMPSAFVRSSSLRRRPASPLHSVANAVSPTSFPASTVEQHVPLSTSVALSGSNSPSLAPQRFTESYPALHHYASSSSFSSLPSTPTSQRSRSPSISSLDTIEDAPDLESEAIEAERIERLKLAAERAERAERGEDVGEGVRRRSSVDVPRGFGFIRGGNRERKRWSVCGGERRADLDLETIYED